MNNLNLYVVFKLGFWALFFLPVYFVAFYGKEIYNSLELRNLGLRTEGTVLAVRERYESDNEGTSTYYIPTVKYYTEESGEIIRDLDENTKPYSRNQKIELLYFPGNAKLARHNSFETLFQGYVSNLFLILFLGLIFGAILYITLRKIIFK